MNINDPDFTYEWCCKVFYEGELIRLGIGNEEQWRAWVARMRQLLEDERARVTT
jgi:hypothetical protein